MAIQVGVGSSKRINSFLAGKDAASIARDKMGRGRPDLTIIFASVIFNQEEMLKGVLSVVGDSPLVGCSGAGEITTEGPEKKSLVVLVLASDSLRATIGLGEAISRDARKAGQQAAREASKAGGERHIFMMMPDGLKGNGADIVRGVQEILGTSFPIVGGSAGDDFLFQQTYQYYNDQVLSDAVTGVLFGGPITCAFGARHGWRTLGKHRLVTRAKANVIYEIDDEPAVQIYEEYFGKGVEELSQEPLARMAILYPLGMSVPGEEEYLLRNALRVERDGSLVCVAEVPEGSEVRLMMGSRKNCIEAARAAAQQALDSLGEAKVELAIVFSSISRYKLLGRRDSFEIDAIREVLGGDVPLVGFYTYGEQAPLRAEMNVGQSYFHNETIVILAIGE